jgi:hypothetical protein
MPGRHVADWPQPGERWRRAVLDGRPRLGGPEPTAETVRDLRVRPGLVEGAVDDGAGASWPASLAVDLLGPSWRERFFAALAGEVANGEAAAVGQVAAAAHTERVAASGLDPVPPPGAVRARCACRAFGEAGWCGHLAALGEAFALRLDAGEGALLWRLRGLDAGQERGGAEGSAAGGDMAPPPDEAVDDRAFWGSDGHLEAPRVEPWDEAPAAVLRLGPLPAARGQAAAVEPILAHYRRVRDAVRTLETPARSEGVADSHAPPAPVRKRARRRAPARTRPASQEN